MIIIIIIQGHLVGEGEKSKQARKQFGGKKSQEG